jgi:hypothetical protein
MPDRCGNRFPVRGHVIRLSIITLATVTFVGSFRSGLATTTQTALKSEQHRTPNRETELDYPRP